MSLRKLIVNKTMAALAVLFTVFYSGTAFAQDAAATATTKPVDMGKVHQSALFLCVVVLATMFIHCYCR